MNTTTARTRAYWTQTVAPTLEPLTLTQVKQHARITQTAGDSVLLSYLQTAREQAEAVLGRGLLTQTWQLALPYFPPVIYLPMAAPLQDDAVAQTIVGNTVANPTVVTTLTPHGLTTGAAITIAGNTGSSPVINGAQTATVISPTSFSVAVNNTVAGTGGTWVLTTPVYPTVQYYDANGTLTTVAKTVYTVNLLSRPASLTRTAGQVWPPTQVLRLAPSVLVTYLVGWRRPEDVPERIKQGIRLYVAAMDADREGFEDGSRMKLAADACWSDRVYPVLNCEDEY